MYLHFLRKVIYYCCNIHQQLLYDPFFQEGDAGLRINEELLEKPDHAHYPVCLDRLIAIKAYCSRSFYFSLVSGIFMGILTLFGIRFSLISIIPNLIGEPTVIISDIVQHIIIIGIAVMAGLSVGRFKIFSPILFIVYALMAVLSLFSSDILSFVIGAAGGAFNFRCLSVYFDYMQLTQTEGFPIFNKRLAEQEENSEYVSRYGNGNIQSGDAPMEAPEQDIVQPEFTGRNFVPEMTVLESSPPVPETNTTVTAVYYPMHKKYCALSESPQRTFSGQEEV